MNKLTQEKLKEVLNYNSETGNFTWKTSRPGCKKGHTVGHTHSSGYIQIRVDNVLYNRHRLAWLYVYGYFPEHGLSYINKKPGDDRIDNLREASFVCNARNAKNSKKNFSGVKGVYWDKQNKKWQAFIGVNMKLKNLGSYKNFHNAVCARLAGEQCLEWSNCDSNSPAFQFVQKNITQGE